MIDDLATRAVLTLAAFLLLGSGLSVISLSTDEAMRQAFRELARHIARELDGIGHIDATVSLRFGSEEHAAVRLPATLSGHPYRLELKATEVRIVGAEGVAVEALQTRVHPFPPTRDANSEEELRELDRTTTLILRSGQPFLVVRTMIHVGGKPTFLTFAHTM